jgi:hypothetical protein
VTGLSRALSNRFQPFAAALSEVASATPQIAFRAQPRIGTLESGAQYTAVSVQVLEFGNLPPRTAFREAIIRPLEKICAAGFDSTMLIVVDALDATLSFGVDENIVTMLAETTATNLKMKNVRLLLTSRPDSRVLEAITCEKLDIDADARASQDVEKYAALRLQRLSDTERKILTPEIVSRACSNIFVAKVLIDKLLEGGEGRAEVMERADKILGSEQAFAALNEVFRETLKRLFSFNLDRYRTRFREVLAVLAAAFEPLSILQIAGATRHSQSDVADELATVSQFLAGTPPQGPFQLFHRTFREFLLTDDEFRVDLGQAHLALSNWLMEQYEGEWQDARASYALRFTIRHLFEAINRTQDRRVRAEIIETSVRLLTSRDFVEASLMAGEIANLRQFVENLVNLSPAGPVVAKLATLKSLLAEIAPSSGDTSSTGPVQSRVRESWERHFEAATSITREGGTAQSPQGALVSQTNFITASGPSVPPPSVMVELELWEQARKFGRYWLAFSVGLLVTAVVMTLGRVLNLGMHYNDIVQNLIYNLNYAFETVIYLLIAVLFTFSLSRLLIGRAVVENPSAVASGPEPWVSSPEVIALRAGGRKVRIIGDLYAASPFFELATLLYLISTLFLVARLWTFILPSVRLVG